ncbi:MAG: hypothetical protein M8353_04365 [ANME-2 cluster archaeon]|nr:hypothetical protein [ANME-2 cluster archaeon]
MALVGEIGGTAEQEAAEYIKEYVSRPMVGYIVGISARRPRATQEPSSAGAAERRRRRWRRWWAQGWRWQRGPGT